MIFKVILFSALIYVASGSINLHKEGWLDRVVKYFKGKFVDDVKRVPPVQINVTIQEAPPGYVDSKEWDWDSVVRLFTLMRENEATRPVLKQLRRMLAPTRRILMSKQQSYLMFPDIAPHDYYESSEEDVPRIVDDGALGPEPPLTSEEEITSDERAVVIVTNPVEARLPSARISVKMLREIMEARALAARVMPSTTKSTIHWVSAESTKPAGGEGGDAGGGKGGGGSVDSGGNGTSDGNKTLRIADNEEMGALINFEEEKHEKANLEKKNVNQKVERRSDRKLFKKKGHKKHITERRYPFRAVPQPQILSVNHPLRNGFGGGYYENYHRAKHRDNPHKMKSY